MSIVCPCSFSYSPRAAVFDVLLSHFSLLSSYFRHLSYNQDPLKKEFIPGLQKVKSSEHAWPAVLALGRQLAELSQPIKCFEAVLLGILCTEEVQRSLGNSFHRWIIRFQSFSNSPEDSKFEYWHALLIFRYDGKFGATGISRRSELAERKLGEQKSLIELIKSFIKAYKGVSHTVRCITLSDPLPLGDCEDFSSFHLNWQALVLRLSEAAAEEILEEKEEKFSPEIQQLQSVLKWFENSSISLRLPRPDRSSLPKELFLEAKTGKVRMKAPPKQKTKNGEKKEIKNFPRPRAVVPAQLTQDERVRRSFHSI